MKTAEKKKKKKKYHQVLRESQGDLIQIKVKNGLNKEKNLQKIVIVIYAKNHVNNLEMLCSK